MFAQRDSPVSQVTPGGVTSYVKDAVLPLQVRVVVSSKSFAAAKESGRIHKIALPPPRSLTYKSVPLLPAPVISKPTSAATMVLVSTVSLRMPTLEVVTLSQLAVFSAPPVRYSTVNGSMNQGSLSPESIIPIVYSVGVWADIGTPSSIWPSSSKRFWRAE